MMGWCSETMGWWMLGGGILGLVAVALFGLVVFLILRWFIGQREAIGSEPQRTEAGEIARRRYAAGEISREAFEQIRRDLGS